eukprot:10561235-Karenia_brevis.AAC.1
MPVASDDAPAANPAVDGELAIEGIVVLSEVDVPNPPARYLPGFAEQNAQQAELAQGLGDQRQRWVDRVACKRGALPGELEGTPFDPRPVQ